MITLGEKYKIEVIPLLMKEFGYKSPLAVPRIEKVVINSGFGKLVAGKSKDEHEKIQKSIIEDLTLIAGHHPVSTKAKKSSAAFKLREGMTIGAKVTLRGLIMYGFLDKIIHVALPRSRDFQGIKIKSVDGNGNLTIAFKEQISFPEVSPEKSKNIFGFEITIVTSAENQEEGLRLLRALGFPIKTEENLKNTQ
ncbi:MAG: 50S ribosomal protein L5 [Candidatus Parcubacteria bacterium]|nr:50S ribosomal protein L5 [Candidatus Parcubacteria bacterium]